MASDEAGWSVPIRVEDVPEGGRHARLEVDAATRVAVAKAIGVLEVTRLQALYEVTRLGRTGLRVTGDVSATVIQSCVVSLDPVTNEVAEEIDIRFSPDAAGDALTDIAEIPETDPPEPLVGGAVDLGAITVEFLALGLDPYPRRPDAVFETPTGAGDAENPFAALAALKRRAGRAGE